MRRAVSVLFLFAVTLSASARDNASHWFELRSQHFVVLTDTNEKQAHRVASQLERMRAVFHTLFPTASDSAGSPIIVLALKDKKDFQALEPEAYLAKGQLDLAGLFMRAPDKITSCCDLTHREIILSPSSTTNTRTSCCGAQASGSPCG
jgi:hypothetical protein